MEVEFAGDQEDDRPDRCEAGEPARTTLGCLEQSVDGLQKSIGLACLSPSPSHYALKVAADHLGDFLHRLDLGAHHSVAPVHQHASHHVDLFALQYLAQLLFGVISGNWGQIPIK